MAQKKQQMYDKWGNPGTGDEYFNTKSWTAYDYSNAPTPSLYDTTGRHETKSDYNDADLQRYANDQYTQYYTGGGKYTAEQVYSGIQREKDIYNAAMAAGDTAAADAAHKRAEAWRATAGYSGGADGSEMITLNGAGMGGMGITSDVNSNGYPKSVTNDPAGGYYVTMGGGYVGGSGSQQKTPSAGYEELKASAQGVNNDADDIARQLYINYMKNTDRTNEMMGLAGLQGSGMQESSLVNLGNTYQEGLYQNERARADSLQAVRTEIAAMLASGQISQDEANALYAGIAGGSYDVAAPEVQGGGYYEPSYTYFVPYADAQAQDPLAPSMTDAEMYAMLNGLSLPDSLIDTYFTPGQAAPTYQQIVDEYAQRNAPKQVQSGGGGNGGGGGNDNNNGGIGGNNNNVSMQLQQTPTVNTTPTFYMPTSEQEALQIAQRAAEDAKLGSQALYDSTGGRTTGADIRNRLENSGITLLTENPINAYLQARRTNEVVPASVLQTIPAQDQLSADVYGQVRRIAQLPNEQQRLNEVVKLAGTGRYRDEEIANMLYALNLR